MNRLQTILASGLTLFVAPAVLAAELPSGKGLYRLSANVLESQGYSDHQHDYSSQEWGVLTTADGIAYGPKSYYENKERLEHPHLTIDEEKIASRWVEISRDKCCTDNLYAHFLEILDLNYYDMTELLDFTPSRPLHVYSPNNHQHYEQLLRRNFFVTHVVSGSSIVFQDIPTLFRRTLAGHAIRAAVAESFLQQKCHGRIPPWFQEGLASYLAQEGFEHLSFMQEFRAERDVLMAPAEMMRHVYPLEDREHGRIARYNAFLMVWHLSENHGYRNIQKLLNRVEEGSRFEAAVQEVYGVSYEELLELLDPRHTGEPTTTAIRNF